MAALALRRMACPLPSSTLREDIIQLWRNEVTRRERRRLLRRLARHDARLIADMGIDVEEVGGAVEGTWDEWHPERILRHLP